METGSKTYTMEEFEKAGQLVYMEMSEMGLAKIYCPIEKLTPKRVYWKKTIAGHQPTDHYEAQEFIGKYQAPVLQRNFGDKEIPYVVRASLYCLPQDEAYFSDLLKRDTVQLFTVVRAMARQCETALWQD